MTKFISQHPNFREAMERQLEGVVPLLHSRNYIYGSNELLPTIEMSTTDSTLKLEDIKILAALNSGFFKGGTIPENRNIERQLHYKKTLGDDD